MNKLNHVAFIMDGNGRWGKKKNKNRNSGHYAGVKTVKKIVEASIKLKIPVVTFYVFSTENWKRPKTEVNFLFNLVSSYFKAELQNVIKNDIKIAAEALQHAKIPRIHTGIGTSDYHIKFKFF